MLSIIESIFEFLFEMLVDLFLITTGEIILSIFTFGSRPMPWNVEEESLIKSMVIFQLSFWVGFFFWIFTISCIVKLVS